jgi:hypothetical protein
MIFKFWGKGWVECEGNNKWNVVGNGYKVIVNINSLYKTYKRGNRFRPSKLPHQN